MKHNARTWNVCFYFLYLFDVDIQHTHITKFQIKICAKLIKIHYLILCYNHEKEIKRLFENFKCNLRQQTHTLKNYKKKNYRKKKRN